jgi:hypothetical protein
VSFGPGAPGCRTSRAVQEAQTAVAGARSHSDDGSNGVQWPRSAQAGGGRAHCLGNCLGHCPQDGPEGAGGCLGGAGAHTQRLPKAAVPATRGLEGST